MTNTKYQNKSTEQSNKPTHTKQKKHKTNQTNRAKTKTEWKEKKVHKTNAKPLSRHIWKKKHPQISGHFFCKNHLWPHKIQIIGPQTVKTGTVIIPKRPPQKTTASVRLVWWWFWDPYCWGWTIGMNHGNHPKNYPVVDSRLWKLGFVVLGSAFLFTCFWVNGSVNRLNNRYQQVMLHRQWQSISYCWCFRNPKANHR